VANSEINFDPTNKLRTSSPQALIDTDFEYGTQVSKWENLATTNWRPYAYASPTALTSVTGISFNTAGSRTVTVTLTDTTGLSNGTPITVQDTLNPIANGTFAVDAGSIVSNTSFTYTARAAAAATGSIFDSNKSSITIGNYYTNAAIGGAPTITYVANKIKVVTTIPHGLSIGNEVQVAGTTAGTSGAPNGTWVVSQVESPTAFYFYSSVTPVGAISGGLVYTRPQGAFLHRPFDGGVIFSSNGNSNYEMATRQTRRYFRYQSGKGVQISSGTILKPNLQIDSIKYTTSNNIVTVRTKDQHNLQPGSTITITGANESIFNGSFTVYTITGYNTFTYTPTTTSASDVTASGLYYASTTGWYGAVNRLGIFDSQNGLFFEYDGQTLYAVRRNSTYQISGRVDITAGSATVAANSGFATDFAKQLAPGDWIVIRGASYRVESIASDTSMTISPAFRGSSDITGAVVSKTIDTRIPQSQWNLDTLDGKGPSGYNLDLSRMQMFYIDYSWYGAGFVRWGLRAANGDVTYVHKLANNNVNFEAYMRSGNLPGRYESATLPPRTTIAASVGASDTSISVASTAGFPQSGTIVVKGSSAYEHVNYAGTTQTSFFGLTRAKAGATQTVTVAVGSSVGTVTSTTGIQVGQRVNSATASSVWPDGTFVVSISGTTITFSQALTGTVANPSTVFIPMGATTGQAFTYSSTAPVAVELAFPSYAPTISHWGTSVIMDGLFDDDKSLLFTYGMTTGVAIASTASQALFSIRLSPSVDNGKAAPFATRDLINRMQLVLRALDISISGGSGNLLVTAVLNGKPSNSTAWSALTAPTSSLAQVALHTSGTTVSGGEVTGGFFVGSTGSIDLSLVRDLGNAILGGGGTASDSQIYPDGPDTLTIVVTNVGGSSSTVLGRLSWTEAQA
jgi:hypothetical protein